MNGFDPDNGRGDGSQDCGAFFLDALGPFSLDQVRVRWTDRPRPTTRDVEQFIDTFWRRRTAQADAEGVRLWDGPLCRLIEYRSGSGTLEMTLGPTCFRDFVGTNLYNAHLRHLHGLDVLSNPVGVSGMVLTASGYLVLGRRSEAVAYHAGRIHPIGGCLEPLGDGKVPDPFAGIVAELEEELGLESPSVTGVVCLGLVRDKRLVQPEMVFDVTVSASADEVRAALSGAAGQAEHAELVVVRDHPASVVSFMESHIDDLTPVALAGLLLHGLRRCGGGWFASARGYLRSLI